MPLTKKGEEILASLIKQHGGDRKKAEQILYDGKNAGTFAGIDSDEPAPSVAAGPFAVTQQSPAPSIPGKAAGILFRCADGQILLVRRGDGGDFPGHWTVPGGHLEEGETAEAAARREALEETGFDYKGPLAALYDDGQFTTFLAEWKEEPFQVTICPESTGFVWTQPAAMPQPTHPGMDAALRVAAADTELAIAELIKDRVATSPQLYANVWLFDLRITGTGTAYRTKISEHVYRPPEHYLHAEFLARCNGLTVIFEHPKKGTLNSEEFADRAIGSIMLPYLKGDEVWGIAKIYDAPAAKIMSEKQLSTSPSVVFHSMEDCANVTLDNGEQLLIEGKPALLDHLAICEAGVWDKGGAPAGVNSTLEGVTTMADKSEEELKREAEAKQKADDDAKKRADDDAKARADTDGKLDKCLAGIDSLAKRMDAVEGRMPASELKNDDDAKKKADDDKRRADEEEAEKKKADDAKKRADDDAKKRADDDAKAKADAEKEEKERPIFADAQARADSVYAALGDAAPRPMRGEGLIAYRQRLAGKLKAHSPDYKDIDVNAINDSALLAVVEQRIYADAAAYARSPGDVPEDQLQEIKTTDRANRQISTFRGRPNAWMRFFKSPARRVYGINKGN